MHSLLYSTGLSFPMLFIFAWNMQGSQTGAQRQMRQGERLLTGQTSEEAWEMQDRAKRGNRKELVAETGDYS